MKSLTFYATFAGVLGSLSLACSGASEETASDSAANTGRAPFCTPDQQLAAYTRMLEMPIKPPRIAGGIDLAGGDAWALATIDDAERANCQSSPLGEDVDNGTASAGWGFAPSFPVVVDYDKATRRIEGFMLDQGYKGTLDFASRPTDLAEPTNPNPFGRHTYSIGVGRQILRDGQPWELNWRRACEPGVVDCWDQQSTELFDALLYTFAPELPSTQMSCIKAQTCLAKAFSTGDGVFGARPLGIYFYVPVASAAQPAASTPGYFYGFTIKQMPFSGADTFVKLDGEGPVTEVRNLGDRRVHCAFKLGSSFQTFLDSCVQVLSDAGGNDLLKKKLLGNATRSMTTVEGGTTGTWLIDNSGIRPGFGSERFDEREPMPTSPLTEISMDLRATGKVLNEYAADGTTLTFAGSAAVYREYARLVQGFLHSEMDPNLPKFPIGAPECLFPANGNTTWRPAIGCTGVEQLVTPAEPTTSADPGVQRVSVGPENAVRLGMKTVLKTGVPRFVFCADPGTFERCNGETPGVGFSGSLFDGTYKQVLGVLGEGNVDNLPLAAQDQTVYLRLWTKALVKYLIAANLHPTNLVDPALETPADGDIAIEAHPHSVIVKFKNRLSYSVQDDGTITKMTFR